MAAEVAGVLTLYYAVSRARLPDRISRVIRRYQGFLICPDERMILINRIAPMLPFVGAFIAVAKWDLRKSLTYVLLGGAIKYGIILSLSTLFLVFLSRGTATLFTIVMVLIIIVLSLVASYVRKQRMEDVDRIA